jgi:hypothetical protein
MAATIFRPAYCTRENVMREIDVKVAQYNSALIDRKIVAVSEDIEGNLARKFYVENTTRYFDWPNFQYSYPWSLWLDQYELAASPTLVVSGTFLTSPVVIPSTDYLLWPYSGPPFTRLDLRRDKNSVFGNNTTPQEDIAITGPFGYWTKTMAAGALTSSMASGDVVAQVSIGSGGDMGAGVGDTLIIDSESMIIQDATWSTPGITYSGGLTSSPPSAADNSLTGLAGGTLNSGETIMVDSEIMLVYAVNGTTAIVKRAFDGTVLATHSGNSVSVKRTLNVLRGQLGTTAASHSNSAPLSVALVPNLIRELATAEAATQLIQGMAGYSAAEVPTWYGITGRNQGQQKEMEAGLGLPGLRDRVQRRYGRQVRTRVV